MKRISIVVLVLCACFVPVAWGQQPASTCTNKWAQFHKYNMRRSNPCEKVLNVHNVGSLGLKWSYATRNDFNSSGSPAVANGVVYVGSEDQNVYALNASTSAKLWSYATGDRVASSPAVANGVVYVGSFDYNVYALNARTGAKLWSYATGSYVQSSPAVANGVVYVGSYDGNMYALNASTGAKLWSYATGYVVYSSPAVANGVV
jgi:outer membrane protein assembly factor BamB